MKNDVLILVLHRSALVFAICLQANTKHNYKAIQMQLHMLAKYLKLHWSPRFALYSEAPMFAVFGGHAIWVLALEGQVCHS